MEILTFLAGLFLAVFVIVGVLEVLFGGGGGGDSGRSGDAGGGPF